MENHQKEILNLLAAGQIDVEEAQKLLNALSKRADDGEKKDLKFFHIISEGESEKERANIKIPLRLLKTGMKWINLIPNKTINKVQEKLTNKGIDFDLRDLCAENAQELLNSLEDLEVTAEGEGQSSVRIFCS